MDFESIKQSLADIAESPRLWAQSRAGYMLSIVEQLERGYVTQEDATAWMWDVIRRLDDDADDPELSELIKQLAQQIGQLDI